MAMFRLFILILGLGCALDSTQATRRRARSQYPVEQDGQPPATRGARHEEAAQAVEECRICTHPIEPDQARVQTRTALCAHIPPLHQECYERWTFANQNARCIQCNADENPTVAGEVRVRRRAEFTAEWNQRALEADEMPRAFIDARDYDYLDVSSLDSDDDLYRTDDDDMQRNLVLDYFLEALQPLRTMVTGLARDPMLFAAIERLLGLINQESAAFAFRAAVRLHDEVRIEPLRADATNAERVRFGLRVAEQMTRDFRELIPDDFLAPEQLMRIGQIFEEFRNRFQAQGYDLARITEVVATTYRNVLRFIIQERLGLIFPIGFAGRIQLLNHPDTIRRIVGVFMHDIEAARPGVRAMVRVGIQQIVGQTRQWTNRIADRLRAALRRP